jgi:hypothetical protein
VIPDVEVHEAGLRVRVEAHADQGLLPQVGRQLGGLDADEAEVHRPRLAVHPLGVAPGLAVGRDHLDLGRPEAVGRPRDEAHEPAIERRHLRGPARTPPVGEVLVEPGGRGLVELSRCVVETDVQG